MQVLCAVCVDYNNTRMSRRRMRMAAKNPTWPNRVEYKFFEMWSTHT